MNVLLNHLRRAAASTTHDPFMAGDLTALARCHFGEMQTTGQNKIITDAARKSGLGTLTGAHVQSLLAALAAQKIVFPQAAQNYMVGVIPEISKAVTPKIQKDLQTFTVLKLQRSIHGELANLSRRSHGIVKDLTFSKSVASPPKPHLVRAEYLPPKLVRVQEESGDDSYSGDAGWSDTSSNTDTASYESLYDSSSDPYNAYDSYDPTYASTFGFLSGTTYTTPSGQVIQLCTVYYAFLGLTTGSWSFLIDRYGAQASLGFDLIASNPELAVAILALIGAYAGWCAIFC